MRVRLEVQPLLASFRVSSMLLWPRVKVLQYRQIVAIPLRPRLIYLKLFAAVPRRASGSRSSGARLWRLRPDRECRRARDLGLDLATCRRGPAQGGKRRGQGGLGRLRRDARKRLQWFRRTSCGRELGLSRSSRERNCGLVVMSWQGQSPVCRSSAASNPPRGRFFVGVDPTSTCSAALCLSRSSLSACSTFLLFCSCSLAICASRSAVSASVMMS